MPEAEITELLVRVSQGDKEAEGKLIERVYPDLRAIARGYLRFERPNHTLQATALVNEAYVKLVGRSDAAWQNRAHFMAAAAMAIRSILIDYARRKNAAKRGGAAPLLPLSSQLAIRDDQWPELIDLNDALLRLEQVSPRQAKVVVLRFFGDMSEEDVAEALHISVRTVKRDWAFARAWLHGEVCGNPQRGPESEPSALE